MRTVSGTRGGAGKPPMRCAARLIDAARAWPKATPTSSATLLLTDTRPQTVSVELTSVLLFVPVAQSHRGRGPAHSRARRVPGGGRRPAGGRGRLAAQRRVGTGEAAGRDAGPPDAPRASHRRPV